VRGRPVLKASQIGVGMAIAFFSVEIKGKEPIMLGWMIVFGLISVVGGLSSMTGATAAMSMKITSLLFASLFFIGLLTYAIRGRAR
jgi:hypothetical protein